MGVHIKSIFKSLDSGCYYAWKLNFRFKSQHTQLINQAKNISVVLPSFSIKISTNW